MSETQRIQAQLKEAIELAQAGQRTAARQLLEDIIAVDPRQELAWLWLATVSTEREERVRFLSKVLTLNPHNTRAQEAYAQLTGQTFVPPEAPPDALDAGPDSANSMSLSLPLLGAILLIGVMGVIFVLVALRPNDEDNEPARRAAPTRFLTATPTRGPSPTRTPTPFPTYTLGPSPTPIDWDALPTWTPEPTQTDAPTRAPLPTFTPLPTRTVPPSRTPIASPTDLPAASDTPLPTATDGNTGDDEGGGS